MENRDWWRSLLGVPDRQWYVRHERSDTSLDVWVADGSVISCAFVEPDQDGPAPVVVVPFYRVSYVIGRGDIARYGSADAAWLRAYATRLARHGVTAVVVPWWFESYADESHRDLAERYAPAVAEHRRRHACTGLGRSVADLVAVLDALDRELSRSVYGCFGHSLGGKLATFLAALDERIAAAVLSEPGLGWAHSNWSAPWYVGELAPAPRDHDEVLALVPPRRLLILTGGESDGQHNAEIIVKARRRVGDLADRIEVIDHGEGHTPPTWVQAEAYNWLRDNLVTAGGVAGR